jgi:hypothetical protein
MWKALFDSVLEVTDQQGTRCHIALRQCAEGTYRWNNPGKPKADWPIILTWGKYSGLESTQPIFLGHIKISRTVKVKIKHKGADGKEEERQEDRRVIEAFNEPKGGEQTAKLSSTYDHVDFTIRVENQTQLYLTSSNGPVNRDDLKISELELYQVVGGVRVPVFRISTPKAVAEGLAGEQSQ